MQISASSSTVYNLIVIGSGPGGYIAAIRAVPRASTYGWDVTEHMLHESTLDAYSRAMHAREGQGRLTAIEGLLHV